MLALRTLAFVALAGWSLAAPLVEVDGASDTNMLVARQRTDWGGEPLVYKPYAEAAQSLGTPCDYQITFRRDTFDDRYYQRYYARYPGSSELRQLNPTTFARRNVGEVYGSYAVDKTHQLQIAQVRGACSAGSTGSTPTFFVRHTLGSGFTYSNDYISPGFTPSTRQLPAVPTNLQLTRVPNTQNYTVSWTRSATATGGYYVLITTRVYEYETGNHTPITTTVKLNATTSSYNFRITGRNYLDFVKVNLESFTDVVGDITKVPRVP